MDKLKEECLKPEIYLLIYKFLSQGPCAEVSDLLRQEIEKNGLLPPRILWNGKTKNISLSEYEKNFPHISHDHLLRILSRIGPILDQNIPPSVPGVPSILGAGTQSLLRVDSKIKPPSSTMALYSRIHAAPPYPSSPSGLSNPGNLVNIISARESCGSLDMSKSFSTILYGKKQMYRRFLGHLSSVYCIVFDRTGKYIFTGADDSLVKVWSALGGRLLATLRGHSAEITDLAVNYENTLIASGSCDKMIRIWSLRTAEPITILTGHTAAITSVKFSPYAKNDERFLISTSNDGSVNIWSWHVTSYEFDLKPFKFIEKNHRLNAQILCSSISPGGCFVAVGSTDHYVRVYNLTTWQDPVKIREENIHSESVDSIQFSNYGLKFVSGSKDGNAYIWWFERQEWHRKALSMSENLPGVAPKCDSDSKNKTKVNMVCWTCDDKYVITAVSDCSLKVWDAVTGRLCHVLMDHEEEVFVLEANPIDPRIFLSGGHDGKIILWDVYTGKSVSVFCNQIDGQGPGSIYDCKFSPDGQMIASTDSHGHLAIYGFGSFHKRYEIVPDHVFFHTDYRPLVRDSSHYVIDEQTQIAPHLMPPPFLVDIDGNPHPPPVQRLVPGRENCKGDQLVPYIAIHNERGVAEVLQPVVPPGQDVQPPAIMINNAAHQRDRPTIDDMIERLARERVNVEHGYAATSQQDESPERANNHGQQAVPGPSSARPGARNAAESVGVRQSVGNWQSREKLSASSRRIVDFLRDSLMNHVRNQLIAVSRAETSLYSQELRRKKLSMSATCKDRLASNKTPKKCEPVKPRRQNNRANPPNSSSSYSNSVVNQRTDHSVASNDNDVSEDCEDSEDDPSFSGVESWNGSSSSGSSSESDSEEDEDDGISNDSQSSPNGEVATRSSARVARKRNQTKRLERKSWKQECRELLNDMFSQEDSAPFRNPVDPIDYPDYYLVVDSPMDLTTVREYLQTDSYATPQDFAKDVELIFRDSELYNTDRKSRIYAMTSRLRSFFRERLSSICSRNHRSSRNGDTRYTLRNKRKKNRLLEDFVPNLNTSRRKESNNSKKKKAKRKRIFNPQPSSSTSSSFDPSQPSTSGLSSSSTSQSTKKNTKSKKFSNTTSTNTESCENGLNQIESTNNVNGIVKTNGDFVPFKSLIGEESDEATDVEQAESHYKCETDDSNDTDATEIVESESHNNNSAAGSSKKRKAGKMSSRRKKMKLSNGSIVTKRKQRKSCDSAESIVSRSGSGSMPLSNDSSERPRRRVNFSSRLKENPDVGICSKCNKSHPPMENNSNKTVDWICCDQCSHWYHQLCILDILPRGRGSNLQKVKFFCYGCKRRSRSNGIEQR
ncbi:bromodomain and WD repeat-containing protein [Brevipalpus obovatus]|uniref:bromodomain and WD repeat-containing protein n=1 Tax=Brevipalpus obovatus TaxID=246614 RepID=UPI003D9E2E9A